MICFIDFETTGIDIFRDEPIDFGAILVDDRLEIINEYSSKMSISKSTYLTKRAFKIHNISINEIANFLPPKEVLINYFNEIGTDYRLGGWNINFDVAFLRKLCHKNGMMVQYNKINHRHIDVQSIGFLVNQLELLPVKNSSLADWIKYFNLERGNNHSALEDSKLTFEVYRKLIKLLKSRLE